MLEVDAVDRVRIGDVTRAEARRSGFESVEALIAELERASRRKLRAGTAVHRVKFRYAGAPQKTDLPPVEDDQLSGSELGALDARLDAMDARSKQGPFTRQILGLIAAHPQVAASKLAPKLGRETQSFKVDVRKLKKLGLTISHEAGYELSPRGHVYWKKRRR